MHTFIAMTREDRRRFCQEAEARTNLSPASVEKDFWVCWTLRELFALPEWGAMREEMFFGEVPSFDEIMHVVGDFEKSFNANS